MNSEELRDAYGTPNTKETWDERKSRENSNLSFAEKARTISVDKSSLRINE